MSKAFLWIAVFLAGCSAVFAANQTIDAWYHLNDTINVTGKTVLVKPVNLAGRVILTIDGRDLGLYSGDCSQVDITKYCLKEVTEEGIGPDGRPVRSYHITVEETAGAVSIGHSASKTGVKIGELVSLTLDITNTGERKIDGLKYELLVPEALAVTNTIECRQDGQKIYWTGSLQPGQQLQCKYEMRAEAPGSHSLRGYATWTINSEAKEEATNNVKVEVSDFELVPKITYDRLKLGQKSQFSLTVQNTVSDTVKATIYVDPPSGIEVDQASYRYTDEFEGKKKVEHNFTGRPVKSGNQTFSTRLVFEVGDLKRDYLRQVSITVPAPDVHVEHDATYRLESGKRGTLDFFIVNSEEDSVRDIVINVTSGLLSGSEAKDLAEANKKTVIWSRPFEAPSVGGDTSFPVTAYISYKNKFGELFRLEDRLMIQVTAPKTKPEQPNTTQEQAPETEPEHPNITQQPVEAPNATEANISEQPSEKRSLWRRFVDWLSGFF